MDLSHTILSPTPPVPGVDEVVFLSINRDDMFTYIVIIIIFLGIFMRLDIGLNIVFGLVLASILIYYLKTEKQKKVDKIIESNDMKIKQIRPPSIIINKYPELVDFIFSIQEFYPYSPINYEDMIDNLEDFLILYENSKIDPKHAGQYYEMAEKKKSDVINALYAIQCTVEVVEKKYYINKINDACEELYFILSAYLDEIYTINQNYIGNNGYNNETKLNSKETEPKAGNYFDDINDKHSGQYTYEVY